MFLFKAKSIILVEQRTGSEIAGILHSAHTRPIIRSLSSQSLSSLLYIILCIIVLYDNHSVFVRERERESERERCVREKLQNGRSCMRENTSFG